MSYIKQNESGGGGDTYTLKAAQSGPDVDIQLDAAAGTDSDVKLKAGTNITLTEASDTITIDAASGGSPGGSNTQVQFNDGGSFGGDAVFTFDKTGGAEQVVVEGSSTADLLRVTQTGSGNAIVVEDATNPDPTRFAVSANGDVGIGTAPNPSYDLFVLGDTRINGFTQTNQVQSNSNGSPAAPRFTRTTDTNTGMYFPGSDEVALATGGSERLRIASAGQIGIAGANYGTAGQVLTSQGAGAAPQWATAGGGGGTPLPQYGDMSGLSPTAYPYVHPAAMPPLSASATTQSVGVLSNDIHFSPMLFTSNTDVGKLWMRNGGTVNPLEIGIYETDSNNLPTNKVISVNVASPTANTAVTANLASTTTLTANEWYWLAIVNTTLNANVTYLNIGEPSAFVSTSSQNNRSTLAITAGTINALPSSITQSDLIPWIYPPIIGVWTI